MYGAATAIRLAHRTLAPSVRSYAPTPRPITARLERSNRSWLARKTREVGARLRGGQPRTGTLITPTTRSPSALRGSCSTSPAVNAWLSEANSKSTPLGSKK